MESNARKGPQVVMAAAAALEEGSEQHQPLLAA